MLIHAVTLYKTPLDPDYTNVFDDVTDANYKSFLDLNYSKTEPLPEIADTVRSLRSSGNTVDIIVIGEKEYLRDYNYCCLQISEALDTPKRYVYYFIMGMDSTSNVNPSSTRISLKYDAFSNNRILLTDSLYNDENMIIRRHYEECKFDISTHKVTTCGIITEEKPVELDGTADTKEKLLWIKARISAEKIHYISSVLPATQLPYLCGGCVPTNGSAPIVFIPFCGIVYQGTTIKIDQRCLGWKDDNNTIVARFVETNPDDSSKKTIIPILSSNEKVLSMELTFHAPFDVEKVVSAGNTYYYKVTNSENFNATHFKPGYTILYDEQSNSLFESAPIFSSLTSRFPVKALVSPDYSYSDDGEYYETSVEFTEDIVDPLTEHGITALLNYESRIKAFPYKHKALYYNKCWHSLIPHKDSTLYFGRYYKLGYYAPKFCVALLDNFNAKAKETLENNGQLIQSVDSLQYFMRNNGNKLIAGALGSMVHYTDTDTSTGVSINTSGIWNAIASVRDADNAMDTYKIPAVEATSDLLQDLVLEIDFDIADERQKISIAKDFHYNGININNYESVRTNYHTIFDKVQTSNCSLPFILNERDRIELEEAYNRGVRRWHIATSVKNFDFLWFNKNLLNLSKEQYKMWEA